jgi:5S rRNA maturation endonuclease (ribonuclease M5)
MSYAILRTAKLTSFGNIGGSASHNFRERNTPNADRERTPNNVTTGAQSSKEVLEAVKARLETVPTVRKNAVLAVEYFIGASPEWFQNSTVAQREAYFDAAEKWLKQRHGAENLIAFTRQYDETSPHVCAYVVPIDAKGKLNASHYLDGRTKLSEMQTDFADKVGKQFDLQRGIEGSTARHTTVKEYYSRIQEPVRQVEITADDLKPRVTRKKIFSRYEETPEAIANRITEAVKDAYQPAVAAAKQYDLEKASNEARERQLHNLRERATYARQMPLESVLERLGCVRDTKDRNNWRTPVGRLSVDGMKFYAHDQAKGGGGAIDLVMMLEQTDYKGAVGILTGEFGKETAISAVVNDLKQQPLTENIPYIAPEKCPENWQTVRQYLIKVRCISEKLIDKLHEMGRLYADKYRNAVFVLGKGEGVELRGTGDKPFHGVRGIKSPFYLAERGEKKVAFVESSIDALSLHELGFKGRIVSMAGNSTEYARKLAAMHKEQGFTVVAAFDNDKAGEKMATNLQACERLRSKGKDWNDDLRTHRSTSHDREAMKPHFEQEQKLRGKEVQQVLEQERGLER